MTTSKCVRLSCFVFTLFFMLAACTGASIKVDSSSSRFVRVGPIVDEADPINIAIPEGWLDNTQAYESSPISRLRIEKEPGKNGNVTGLRADRMRPEIVAAVDESESIAVDIWSYRNGEFDDALEAVSISGGVLLPARVIDGQVAPGYQLSVTEPDGRSYEARTWFVLRRDGVWEISVISELGSKVFPQELLDAIDTIHWTPLGAGAPTEKLY